MKQFCIAFVAVIAFCAPGLRGQSAESQRPAAASLSGVVYDSLTGHPLGLAVVQLANADSLSAAVLSVVSDTLGRFLFAHLAPARYLVGFTHPVLDSLGIEPKPREIVVSDSMAARLDLAVPSALTLRSALCGAAAVSDSDALIIGFVRRANDPRVVDSAVVSVQWSEFLLEKGRMSRNIAHRDVAAQESGWYAVCGAPSGGTILIYAVRATDSTETLDVEVPANGFLRRDLTFGTSRLAAADSLAHSDSIADGPRRIGDGRLSGTVVAAVSGRPIAGARVGILNGLQTRADERGAWSLIGLPTGTRTLEVRAVAHYPVAMPVDVVDGAGPVRIAMATLQSVLDTVRVTAKRNGSTKLLDFLERRKRSGAGRFITSEDMAARNPIYTTDMFRSMPGISVLRTSVGEEVLVMRGSGFAAQCRASVYLNGMSLRGMSVNDINGFVRPLDVIGIEVYSAASAPPQFSESRGCGSVVIWSR